MSQLLNRLGVKFTLVTLVFTLSLAAVTTSLVFYGFKQTQIKAVERSAEGLEVQGSAAILDLAQNESQVSAAQLQPAIDITRNAAAFMARMAQLQAQYPWSASSLVQADNGNYYNADPNRNSELIAGPNTPFDNRAVRDIRDSAGLDGLFPTYLQQFPQAVAIYYLSPNNVLRYYPVIDLIHATSNPGLGPNPTLTDASPEANPEHKTLWSSAYLDNAGQGLLVTASSPVYQGNEFRGVIAVDLSLTDLVKNLNDIRPTENGYAFLIDKDGYLVAAPEAGLADLFYPEKKQVVAVPGQSLGLDLKTASNVQLLTILGAMRRGEQGVENLELGGRHVLLSYAPLTNIGWSLGLVAPLSEVTAQSQNVAASIRNDAATTIRFTLLVMGIIFLLAIIGTAGASRQLLARPIATLVSGVRAISSGDLNVSIPVRSQDELGLLARAFNHMSSDLKKRNQELASANVALAERELQYRSIFEATSDGLLINDFDGNLIDFNLAASTMHGYTPEEFRQLQPSQFIHPDSWQTFLAYIEAAAHGEFYRAQALDIRKDGSTFYVELNGQAFTFRGQPHTLAVVRDITEQVQAYQLLEQRVSQRTRELSTLLEVSRNVASTLQLNPLLDLILDQLNQVVGYRLAAIYILEEASQLVLWDQRGLPASSPLIHELVDLEDGAGAILQAGHPLILPDSRPDPLRARFWQALIAQSSDNPADRVASWLGVPLLVKEQAIGMMVLAHPQADYYTARSADLAMALANQAAVAIENARLYEQAQELAALQERQKLARELHDSVSQALYGIGLGARTARTLLERDPSKAADPLDYVLSLTEAGQAEMRALIFELRPESLETEGLVAALTKQTAAMRARHQIQVETSFCEEPPLPIEAKQALYRVAQEALHNIVKHAQASQVNVVLECEPGWIRLEIRDDGRGFDPQGSFPGHLGLRSMRERIDRLNGTFEISSAPGSGTRIQAGLPLPT